MPRFPIQIAKNALLVLAAFSGGVVTSKYAIAQRSSPDLYAPFNEIAKALVLIETEYVDVSDRNKILEGAVKGMVAGLDPHSEYMNKSEFAYSQDEISGRFAGVGIEIEMRNGSLIVLSPMEDSPAEKAGIQAGDHIVAVDGKLILVDKVDQLVPMLRGAVGSEVTISIRRANTPNPLEFRIRRELINVRSIASKRLEHNVAYIRIKQFQEGTHTEFMRALGTLRSENTHPLTGVLLDMRNNPGGLVNEAEAIADEFLEQGVIYSTRHRGIVAEEIRANAGGALTAVPVVILTNEYSASSAELLAGALQDSKRATIVGNRTFGKGSVQTIFELPSGSGMRLTTLRYYTPSGFSIQASGITPDILLHVPNSDRPEFVREADLQGHLASESIHQPKQPTKTIHVNTNPSPSRNIPSDPSKSDDPFLRIGFETLLSNISSTNH